MKIIELLNKIANGEEVPSKILYDNQTWEYDKNFNQYENDGDGYNLWNGYNFNILNNEVEIIEEVEEPKKIEPIEKVSFSDKESAEMNILFMQKINEIIDFLNKEK